MMGLTVASALGLMIGSLISGSFVKIGRRKAILIASTIQMIGAAFMFWYSVYYIMFAAKVLYGAMGAVQLTGCAIYLSETLPADKVATHGYAVNLGVTIGISVCLLAGSFVDPGDMSWLGVALILPVFDLIVLSSWLCLFRYEPIGFCLEKGDSKNYKEQALRGI